MSETEKAFAAVFGQDQADAIMAAAEMHENGIHDNRGSDPFRWALTICIGYECYLLDDYRKHHGITADAALIDQWVKDHANLGDHDGDVDYLAAFCGKYDEYLPKPVSS